jgi:Signal recognition particle GTPase
MFDLFKRDAEPDRRPWGERLKAGLGLSRERLTRPLNAVFGRRTLSDETLEELEAALLEADVGVPATTHLLAQLAARAKRAEIDVDARTLLKAVLTELLLPLEQPLIVGPERPFVMMIAGVNGTGKTTSIGKLAKYLQGQGYSVLLAAGDTFRAAAREQLEIWGERNGVPVIAQQGGDPAAVMFDAIAAARARGIDVVLADPTMVPDHPALDRVAARLGARVVLAPIAVSDGTPRHDPELFASAYRDVLSSGRI